MFFLGLTPIVSKAEDDASDYKYALHGDPVLLVPISDGGILGEKTEFENVWGGKLDLELNFKPQWRAVSDIGISSERLTIFFTTKNDFT